MSLDNLIKGSYGIADNIFAGHAFDAERAAQSLHQANVEGVGFADFIEKHKAYLRSKNCSAAHIAEQIERVKDIERYFKY